MAKVFVSYSHKDSDKKESLLTHLRVLETAGTLSRIELWEDTMIGLGEAWRKEIEDALERADIAVLLVTEHFLTSDFILHEEVRLLLERHKKSRDLYIVPLIASPCDWQAHRWLADLQVFHNGRPIWEDGVNHVATDLAEVAGKVRDHVLRPPTEHATGNRYAHIVYLSPDDGEDGARSVDPSRLLGRPAAGRVRKRTSPALRRTCEAPRT